MVKYRQGIVEKISHASIVRFVVACPILLVLSRTTIGRYYGFLRIVRLGIVKKR